MAERPRRQDGLFPWSIVEAWSYGSAEEELQRQTALWRGRRLRAEAEARRVAGEVVDNLSDADTESFGDGARSEPEGAVVDRDQASDQEVASDGGSSGRGSPAQLGDPAVVVQYRAHRHAHAWGTMGVDLMERLELVALEMRGQAGGQPSLAPVGACELYLVWDQLVRAAGCDTNPGCLFDTVRVVSDSD